MIVHIATDEKFINSAYHTFETALPGKNKFIILKKKETDSIKYLDISLPYNFVPIENEEFMVKKVSDKINEARSNIIVFHGMITSQAIIALDLPNNYHFIWMVFGAEIYNNPVIYRLKGVGNITLKRYVSVQKRIKTKTRTLYHYITGKKDPYQLIKKSINKMDFVAILYREEFELYNKLHLLKDKCKWLKFTYYPLDIVVNKASGYVSQNNILIGNSASYTNNHLEAFALLKKAKLDKQRIIVPLSYGDANYGNSIVKIGKELFGDNFTPLMTFMSLKDYQEVTQSCGIVIMNHYRQQAVGNVVDMLYRGAKIYLSEKNTLYYFLKRIGCVVFNIEQDLEKDIKKGLAILSKEEMINNRKIISKELTLESNISTIRNTLIPLLNK